VDGLALHPVKSVAASPQQVSLFLAQPEQLEQGPEKTESASEAKINHAIDGRHLKECTIQSDNPKNFKLVLQKFLYENSFYLWMNILNFKKFKYMYI
jgi:hypothetical protein